MTNRNYNIGIFDSGFGGLTIMKEILKGMPDYNYIYLGDNARAPYGNRSFTTVYEYTLQAVKKLFELDCYLVILACNTASAKALRTIQQKDLPVLFPNRRILGIIRPSTEAVDSLSFTKHIGILGTNGTVKSDSYVIEVKKLFPHVHVVQEACPMWVPLVENNEYDAGGADYFIKKNIDSLLEKDPLIDTIILGCTHYPLLSSKIRSYTPARIKIVNQGEIVAQSLKNYMERHPEIEERCSKHRARTFFTTESPDLFNELGSKFLGEEISSSKIIL